MTSAIRPIETHYGGCAFRSRLEARWAVLFDQIGARWEYEPEGYELPGHGRYLPDFFIASTFYIEVKPGEYFDGRAEWEKWAAFALGLARELLVVFGMPAPETRCVLISPPSRRRPSIFDDETPTHYAHGDTFLRLAHVAFPGCSSQTLYRAIEAARSARFEHFDRRAVRHNSPSCTSSR